ncbi:MAG: hypothetical protein AUG51_21700 [Acidobacteria bacterium 13_1_20CM_3_53_8]|nr:MAG: hypothetical protein AUG51_21700 [Acidobacteria bacterium 13_1_20CM_3_53_8]
MTPELVVEAMNDAEGFGRWLAKANRQLNSFFMVCTNSALVNPSTNKHLKDTKELGLLAEEDTGWKDYLETLRRLQAELVERDDTDAPICESCGERTATNILKRVGRDFFPLAGSLGNDAQALPAASRAPRVCALCLIAIQWLPIGGILFNGKLACFQFTEPTLSQRFVEDTYRENRNRLASAKVKDKVPAYGSKQGATPAAKILIDRMRLMQEDIEFYELPKDVSLNIWAFSNSGASPECEVFEIHNPALQFLWKAAQKHYTEISELLKREVPNKSATHLLTAIENGTDYGGFYPRKPSKKEQGVKPASRELYELYQTRILNRTPATLEAGKILAPLVFEQLSGTEKKDKKAPKADQKLLEQLLKENPRWSKDAQVRIELRKRIAKFAEAGHFTLEQYVRLFPAANVANTERLSPEQVRELWKQKGSAIKATNQGWDLFWFYLHHAANGTLSFDKQTISQSTDSSEDLAMFTNPKIQQFARDVFAMQLERRGGKDKKRGLDYIKRNILDAFARGQITNARLREWFIGLADSHPDYKNEDWDALCRDEQGRDAIGELRFQMRLELANLYRIEKEVLDK